MEAALGLTQFHALKVWHARHGGRQPFEKHVWDVVVTIWVAGWVGLPTALLLHLLWALSACIGAMCLPGLYVQLRRQLHASRWLRCDWMTVLR